MNTIYIVKASKHIQYEGSQSSIVFTCLNKDEAVSFAQDYYKKNESLVCNVQMYDALSLSVFSSEIGKPNTEVKIWSSLKFSKHIDFKSQSDRINLEFSYDLESSLLDKFKQQVLVNLKEVKINPTIGWAAGYNELDVTTDNESIQNIVSYAIDQYRNTLKNISSDTITEMSIPFSFEDEISKDAESKENKEMWALYEKYEQQFHIQ